MLKKVLFLILVLISTQLKAEVSDPEGVFESSNELYENHDYEGAKEGYLSLIDEQFYSSELFLNLGNACYKLDDLPGAVLYYEKALKLSPGNEDILHNLKLTNKKITDKVYKSSSVQLSDALFIFLNKSPNFWASASILLSIIGFALLILFLFLKGKKGKMISFYGGLLILLFCLISVIFAAMHKSKLTEVKEVVIFEPSVQLMHEPTEHSSVSFVLHEGTKGEILGETKDWYEIKYSAGKVGWIKKEFVKEI